jgi:hypothetical protein
MKIRPVAAEFSHADRLTDLNDETNSLFRNFAKAPNNVNVVTVHYYLNLITVRCINPIVVPSRNSVNSTPHCTNVIRYLMTVAPD